MPTINLPPYMEKKLFSRLRGSPAFDCVRIDYSTVVWSGVVDTSSETLSARSVLAGSASA